MAARMGVVDLFPEVVDFIRQRRLCGISIATISQELRDLYPGVAGLSVRSIELICHIPNCKSSGLSQADLNRVVASAVYKVGPTYGRKTMCGLLRSQGIKAGEKQIGVALSEVNPEHHLKRLTRTEAEINPHPYFARYFGHKLHIDQNEKLVMFGVTHVAAIDGFSRKIVGFVTMPIKNNLEIYTHLYRPLVLMYGLWDELRVDQGKEWVLSLFVQEQLASWRTNTDKPPHLQSTSTKNHIIERIWVEINKRVNYPIKKLLYEMEAERVIHTEGRSNRTHCFCVSWVATRVASAGAQLAVNSWNYHPIPGHGIPNNKASCRRTAPLNPQILPSPSEALMQFEATGGHLQCFSIFGHDPLDGYRNLQELREVNFKEHYVFDDIFHGIINNDRTLLEQAILHFISTTDRLSSTL